MSMTSVRLDSMQPASTLTSEALSTTEATSLAPLPAFRSVQEFPRKPKPDQLAALYSDCLQTLQQANSARSILKGRMEVKKQIIFAIRLEIDRLEQDFVLEADTRTRLHAMNLRLVEALQEMDSMVGDLNQVVDEACRVPRSRLGRLIDRLKALIHRWRTFQRRQHQEWASLEGSQQDGGRP